MNTLTGGIEINGEALAEHTVGYYPAGMQLGVENTGGEVGRHVPASVLEVGLSGPTNR